MKKFTKGILCTMLALCMLCVGICLTGCGESVELYQEDNIYEIAPGKSIQLSTKKNGLDVSDKIEYIVTTDNATISNSGLLTAKQDATVQSLIKVYAQCGKVKSKEIKITVVDLEPESIKLNADGLNIANNSINFSVSYNPTYATLKDYTLSVTKINDEQPTDENKDWIILTGNIMTLKQGAEIPANTTFEITATLKSNQQIKDSVVITKIDPTKISYIIGSNVNIIATVDSNKYVDISAYNELNEEIENYPLSELTYTSSNESVATIDENGKIVPKGHGTTLIKAKSVANEKIETSFNIFVMITPENININNVKVDTFSYSKQSSLSLDIKATNSTYSSCTNAFDYKFEMVDGSFSGDDVATVSDGEITFNKTGKVKVTVTSNSSLNNFNTKNYEKSKEIIVDVNEGVNIKSVADFVAFAKQTSNTVANIATDLNLTSEENFGVVNGTYPSLTFVGDRTINGNGFILSTLNLPLYESDNVANDLLRFEKKTTDTPFVVEINNFEIVGCGGLNGEYAGTNSADKGKYVITSAGKYCHTYRRAIRIAGDNYEDGRAYAKDLKMQNVKVSGFDVGIRIDHAVDGYLSDINISKCFSNGMEFNQNTLTLNNVTLGQVGAFGIEMTPDDIQEKASTDPKTCAGENYDETPSLKLTGYIHSDNYNNGSSTTYMTGLTSQLGMSVPQLMDTIIKGTIDYILQGVSDDSVKTNLETKLTEVMTKCLKRNGNDVNFYLLIFVNKSEIQYNKGNTENKFATYTSNDSANMINVNQILLNLAQNENDTTYKNYQYIQMDLDTQDLSKGGNLGQVILVNQAYEESK